MAGALMHEYEDGPRVAYAFDDEGEYVCVRVCPKCGRFVKADQEVTCGQLMQGLPNATCSKHGRVTMPSEGWF
jgi:hypothetical protein